MSGIKSNEIRSYELDWLRMFALIAVFFYHSVHFFDVGYWSIKNATTYKWISWLMSSIDVWVIPLFFVISGASIYYAANKRNALGFIRDKIMRLFIPLFVGVFSFSIMQVYLERVSHKQYQGSFISFIPRYFEGLYIPGGTGNFAFHGMHLWYLLFLFIFSLLFLPLFWWFKGNTGLFRKNISITRGDDYFHNSYSYHRELHKRWFRECRLANYPVSLVLPSRIFIDSSSKVTFTVYQDAMDLVLVIYCINFIISSDK